MFRKLPVILLTLQVKIMEAGIRGVCNVLNAMEEFVANRKG